MHATIVNHWLKWDISALRESVQQYLGNGVTSSQSKQLMPQECNAIYEFLHISTKSANAYHCKHPATTWGSPNYAPLLLNTHQSLSIYKLYHIHISKMCMHMVNESYPCLSLNCFLISIFNIYQLFLNHTC